MARTDAADPLIGRLRAGDVHVHIHFDGGQPTARASAAQESSCQHCSASPTFLDQPPTPPSPDITRPDASALDGQPQRDRRPPGPRMAKAPPTLPLQPMTKLIAFDDGLADLVSDVETLISFRGDESSPHDGAGACEAEGRDCGGTEAARIAMREQAMRFGSRGPSTAHGSEASVNMMAGACLRRTVITLAAPGSNSYAHRCMRLQFPVGATFAALRKPHVALRQA